MHLKFHLHVLSHCAYQLRLFRLFCSSPSTLLHVDALLCRLPHWVKKCPDAGRLERYNRLRESQNFRDPRQTFRFISWFSKIHFHFIPLSPPVLINKDQSRRIIAGLKMLLKWISDNIRHKDVFWIAVARNVVQHTGESEILSFWILSIVRNSEYKKRKRFRKQIQFQKRCFLVFRIPDDG
jgi:hypothetical protein